MPNREGPALPFSIHLTTDQPFQSPVRLKAYDGSNFWNGNTLPISRSQWHGREQTTFYAVCVPAYPEPSGDPLPSTPDRPMTK
jgi:hypothetical protein